MKVKPLYLTLIGILLLVSLPKAEGKKLQDSQKHHLTVEVLDYKDSAIYWASTYGDKTNILDTIHRNQNGVFKYNIPYGTPTGIYKVIINKKEEKTIDVVYNQEDIVLKTHYGELLKQLNISQSRETQIFHRYQRAKNYIRYKQKQIRQMLERYPRNDPFYSKLEKKYIQLQKERYDSAKNIRDAYPNTFVAKLVDVAIIPFDSSIQTRSQWVRYKKNHFFDKAGMMDESLLRSPVIPNKILDFLSLYRQSSYTKARQEQAFKKAVDTLIKYTRGNAEIFDFTINFLIEGFRRFEFNRLIDHIAGETEEALKCINEERRDEMQKKINRIQTTSPGAKAPSIKLPNLENDTVRLKSVRKPFTLVVFWASWCPHCMNVLPALQDFYKTHRDSLEIYAVSIDKEREKWKQEAQKYPWIHVSQLEGWQSKPVEDYSVYGTPSFFLLDEKKKIIAREGSLKAIKNHFTKKTQD